MVKIIFNKEKNIWENDLNNSPDSIYMDKILKQKLDNIKRAQEQNWDVVFIICGGEGSGKSTLSFICGQYLSNMGLTVDNICAGGQDALKKINDLPNKSVLILDEAELLFASKDSMRKEQRRLVNVMMTVRQKNMVLILVTPSFFDLSKYIAVTRSRFLIRTYTDKRMERGRFMYWGEKRKRLLYAIGKTHFDSYAKPKSNFRGVFKDYVLPFDKQYKKLKLKALNEALGEEPTRPSKMEENKKREVLIEVAKKLAKILPITSREQLAKGFDVSTRTLFTWEKSPDSSNEVRSEGLIQ